MLPTAGAYPHPAAASSAGMAPVLVAALAGGVVRSVTWAIRGYQLTVSPAQTFLFGATGGCRFTPSCSVYTVEALQKHGLIAGTALAVRRIGRCHPWGGCGCDPVPPGSKSNSET